MATCRRSNNSNLEQIARIIDSTLRQNPLGHEKQIEIHGRTLILKFKSSDSIYNSRFLDAYFQLLIFNTETLIGNYDHLEITVSTANPSTEHITLTYDRLKMDRIIHYYSRMVTYRMLLNYTIENMSASDLIDFDANLNVIYEVRQDERFNLRFKDLLYNYSIKCDGLNIKDSTNYDPSEIMLFLRDAYREGLHDNIHADQIDSLISLCDY